MKQVDGEQAQFATEPDDQSEVWAGSSKIFWAIAALIVLILGTLLAFRFGTEVRDLVLYWLGLVGAAPVADYEGGGHRLPHALDCHLVAFHPLHRAQLHIRSAPRQEARVARSLQDA
jgi:hypothetical protein